MNEFLTISQKVGTLQQDTSLLSFFSLFSLANQT